MMAALRASFANRPAFIEPWNVTQRRVEVAERLRCRSTGQHPTWHLGFKSHAGGYSWRRTFLTQQAEDIRTTNQVLAAIIEIRKQRPSATGAVVKLDDSGAGDGNVIIEFDHLDDPLGAAGLVHA